MVVTADPLRSAHLKQGEGRGGRQLVLRSRRKLLGLGSKFLYFSLLLEFLSLLLTILFTFR